MRKSGSLEGPPGVGNSNPHQHSCLEKSTDREAWQAMVHGITKSQTQQNTYTQKGPPFPSLMNKHFSSEAN